MPCLLSHPEFVVSYCIDNHAPSVWNVLRSFCSSCVCLCVPKRERERERARENRERGREREKIEREGERERGVVDACACVLCIICHGMVCRPLVHDNKCVCDFMFIISISVSFTILNFACKLYFVHVFCNYPHQYSL